MYVERVLLRFGVRAPGVVHKLRPRDDAAGVGRQLEQQPELLMRQFLPVCAGAQRERVAVQLGAADFAAARRRSAWIGFTQKVADFGSLLTGRRSVFSGTRRFATVDPPEDFSPPPGGMPEMPDLDDMPFDYVVSSVLSSINTVLVFGTAGAGLLSLVVYRRRKKNAERYVSQVIPDTSMANFTDEQLEKILFYGVTDDDAGEAPPEPAAQDAPPPAVPAVPDEPAADGDPPDGAHGSSDDAAGS